MQEPIDFASAGRLSPPSLAATPPQDSPPHPPRHPMRLSDGAARSAFRASAIKAAAAFRTCGTVLDGITLATPRTPSRAAGNVRLGGMLIATREHAQLPRLIKRKVLLPAAPAHLECRSQAALDALRRPIADSLSLDAGVVEVLRSLSMDEDSPLETATLRDLVAAGERLVQSLHRAPLASAQRASPAILLVHGMPHSIVSGMYTARAIAWYAVAVSVAASIEAFDRERFMGPLVVDDPQGRIRAFLAAAPTAVSHDGSTVIDDHRRLMPGRCGRMRIDKRMSSEGTRRIAITLASAPTP